MDGWKYVDKREREREIEGERLRERGKERFRERGRERLREREIRQTDKLLGEH